MAAMLKDLIHGEAELGSDEDDESFDEEGEPRARTNGVDGPLMDSSEEDEDDDDPEAAQEVGPLIL